MQERNNWTVPVRRPRALQDQTRDSNDDDYKDRDYEVAALANNLSQAFQYGLYSNDEPEVAHDSVGRVDEDAYFDDESAKVVISSLRLGDDQESGSLFTNSNWFAFEDERTVNEHSTDSVASPSPNIEGCEAVNGGAANEVVVKKEEDLADTASSDPPEAKPSVGDPLPSHFSEDSKETETSGCKRPQMSAECTKISDSVDLSPTSDSANTNNAARPPSLPNGELIVESGSRPNDVGPDTADASTSSVVGAADS